MLVLGLVLILAALVFGVGAVTDGGSAAVADLPGGTIHTTLAGVRALEPRR